MGACSSQTASQTVPDTDLRNARLPRSRSTSINISAEDGENDLDTLISPNIDSTDCIIETDVVFEFPDATKNEDHEEETSETAETKAGSRALSRRASTANVIVENIINGWKEAIKTGNDTLCAVLYNDYQEYSKDFIDTVFNNGDNSLHVACVTDTSESHKLVCFLLNDCKMNIHGINNINGKTALHYACEQRDDDLVSSLLFTFYANPCVRDNNGTSPLHIARSKEHKCDKIEELLVRAIENDATITNGHGGFKRAHSRSDGDIVRESFFDKEFEADEDDNNSVQSVFDIMTQSEEIEELKLSKLTKNNPFRSRFQKTNAAAHRDHIAQGYKLFFEKKNKLPKLRGWQEKQCPKPPFLWQKRWVIVVDDYLLWGEKEINISNKMSTHNNNTHQTSANPFARTLSSVDRMQFNNNLKINSIINVTIPTEAEQSETCFIIRAEHRTNSDGTLREYLWKCQSKEKRDSWVKGLRQHMNFYKEAEKYDIY